MDQKFVSTANLLRVLGQAVNCGKFLPRDWESMTDTHYDTLDDMCPLPVSWRLVRVIPHTLSVRTAVWTDDPKSRLWNILDDAGNVPLLVSDMEGTSVGAASLMVVMPYSMAENHLRRMPSSLLINTQRGVAVLSVKRLAFATAAKSI